MKFIVDRIEGEYIVCENFDTTEISNLDRTLFPSDIRSGDLVELIDNVITVLPNDEIKERIKEKMNNLWT